MFLATWTCLARSVCNLCPRFGAASRRRASPKACDLHRTHVSLLERGRINVTVNTARQIAHVLQTSLSELFCGFGPNPQEDRTEETHVSGKMIRT